MTIYHDSPGGLLPAVCIFDEEGAIMSKWTSKLSIRRNLLIELKRINKLSLEEEAELIGLQREFGKYSKEFKSTSRLPTCNVCKGSHETVNCPHTHAVPMEALGVTAQVKEETAYGVGQIRIGKELKDNDALFSQKESTETPKYKVWVEYRDTLVRIGEVYVDPNGTNNRALEVLLAGIIDKVRELEEVVKKIEFVSGGL